MRLLFLAALAASSLVAHAATVSDIHIIPAAAHAAGANGELWKTDITLFNATGETIAVDIDVAVNDGAIVRAATAVAVPPNGTVMLADALAERATSGALLLSGTAPFAVTSRTYAERNGGTVGQSIGPSSDFLDAARPSGFLTGLVSNTGFRTNIGFVAASGSTPVTLEIELMDASGATLGTRSFDVGPNQFAWRQLNTLDITSAAFDAASARVTLHGDGVATMYASVVDNFTSDGIFITGVVDGESNSTSALRSLMERRIR